MPCLRIANIHVTCKTSVTGYLQRKFMKALENLKISVDHSVRNADGSIVQFKYGDDGFDAVKIEKQKISTFNNIPEIKMKLVSKVSIYENLKYYNN